ncbi:hypothetical protein [Nocardia sp. NPDC006630]|uniref:hypothetical protein n=1 Tax=Nocardia sp. NPDC006630 TaxID=3157181 RepID=UPI0033A3C46A
MNELLRGLPEIPILRNRCRAMAMLDAVLSPEWEGRYHSFNSRWAAGEEMASMRNGSGDDWFIVFSAVGVCGRGFNHEIPNAPQVLDAVPAVFEPYVTEPAFADHDGSPRATLCFWREPRDTDWGVSATDRGGHELFELLVDGTPEGYQEWAQDYYEAEVSLAAIEHVYALLPLTPAVVAGLNPAVDLLVLEPDLIEIGYPH